MEQRPIDANALTRHLIDKVGFYPAMVARAIKDAPTIDTVKHGKWLDNGERTACCTLKPFAISCSVCGSSQGATWMNYCPHCGARMDGDINGKSS